MRRFALTLLLLAALALPGAATIYYVDTASAAGGDGTTQALTGEHCAWDTIADVNAASFNAGDSVLFMRGCTWREQLTVPSSGSAGSVITFGAYGTGADPIISGANLVTSWTGELVGGEDFTDVTGNTPEAYWYLEEASGTRLDETANNNDLSPSASDPARSATHVQGSYSVNIASASNQYLTIAQAALSANFPLKKSPTTDFTIGGWVYFNGTPDDADIILSFVGTTNTQGVTIRIDSDGSKKFGVQWYDSSWKEINSNAAASASTWYHVVARWQGGTDDEVSLFINGTKQAATGSTTDWSEVSGNALFFGARASSTNNSNCLMDEWFAFDEALTDSQISDIYNYRLTGSPFTVYYATLAAEPKVVYEDGARLTEVSEKAGLTVGTWYWDAGNTRLYIRTSGDNDVAGYTIEASQRDTCITINAKDYVTVDNITANYSSNASHEAGIWITGNGLSNIIVQNCTSHGHYEYGIRFKIDAGSGSDVTIDSCESYGNGADGINVGPNISDWIITGNTVYNNGWGEDTDDHDYNAGIKANNPKGTGYIEHNTVYGTYANGEDSGTGIWADTTADGEIVVVRYNLSHDNGQHGIKIEQTNDTSVYYNVIYSHTTYAYGRGIHIARGCHDNAIYNNVIYDSVIGIGIDGDNPAQAASMTGNLVKNNIVAEYSSAALQARFGGENDGTNGSGNVYTNNCFGAEAANFIEWGGGTYKSTYDTWETAYGETTSSVESDPLFTDAASADFTIPVASPCRNAGVDVGLTEDYAGNPIVGAPDIGAYEVQVVADGPRKQIAVPAIKAIVVRIVR